MAVLDILVDAVHIVDSPGVLCWGVEHINTEGEIGLGIVQTTHQRRQDVYLLRYLLLHLGVAVCHARLIDDNRRAEASKVCLVLHMVGLVGMVAGQHEDGVLEPRLATGLLEEAAYSHVGIAYALMDDQSLFGIDVLILLGNDIGMVRRGCEDRRHEGFLHLGHLSTVVL